jgi:NACalpha-BTF3-like transcription factor
VQRLYPANNNIKDTIRGAVRTLVEEGKLENCGVSGHPIYRVAAQMEPPGMSTGARVESRTERALEYDISSDEDETSTILYEGVRYELDGDGVSVYDDDGDHVGNWSEGKIEFLNAGWRKSHEEKKREDVEEQDVEDQDVEEQDVALVESRDTELPRGDDVQEFLKENKLEMWGGKLREIGLTDLSFLKYLCEEDLKEIGMPKLHIRCILDKNKL